VIERRELSRLCNKAQLHTRQLDCRHCGQLAWSCIATRPCKYV
jgi:hypothetical protein